MTKHKTKPAAPKKDRAEADLATHELVTFDELFISLERARGIVWAAFLALDGTNPIRGALDSADEHLKAVSESVSELNNLRKERSSVVKVSERAP